MDDEDVSRTTPREGKEELITRAFQCKTHSEAANLKKKA